MSSRNPGDDERRANRGTAAPRRRRLCPVQRRDEGRARCRADPAVKEKGRPEDRPLDRSTERRKLEAPVLETERIHARELSRREEVHAGVVGVVHEILDRVATGLVATRIKADGATLGGGTLRGGIAHGVAASITAALKRVIEPEPVTDLVGGGVAQVVRRRAPARNR